VSDTASSAVTAETAGAVQPAAVAQPANATKQASEADLTAESSETAKTDSKKNEKKWGKAAMAAGYTIIPDVLLKAQRALGLDSLDLNILLHLVKHWWEAERAPYLGKSSIAELIGVNESTVRRRIFALEKAGLLKRVRRSDPTKGDQTNAIDLSPLVKKLEPHAEKALELIQERKAHKALRDKRLKKTAGKTPQPVGD
jgi:predicted transcriptional regulator